MEYKNILIIKMSSVGDILHALPFAAALRERYPQAKISWLVHPQFAGFIPEAPWIDEVLYFDKEAFKAMGWRKKIAYAQKLRQELQRKKFDLVVDLQGLFKSGVMAYLTGCPTKIGYCEMREGSGLVSRAITGEHSQDHVIERYLDVARYLGAKVQGVDFPMPNLEQERAAVQAKLTTIAGKKYVVLVPGARWETKQWPTEYYARLAQFFVQDGYGVVLAGGKADQVLGAKIKLALPKHITLSLVDLIGQTTLRELAALIKDCIFYVSADTGPLHMASAYKKPLLAMYGPTKPERTGPYGNPQATILTAEMPCAGCLKKHCTNWQCMHSITPEQVYRVFQNKMKGAEGNGVKQ